MGKGKSKAPLISAPQLMLLIVISAIVLVFPGSDIYTHVHEAWLFNHMIENRTLLQKDFTMLSGEQPLYGVGAFSYLTAGIGWFLFQKSAVKVLEVLFFLGLVLVTLKTFRNKQMLFFWYGLIFLKILLPDSYPYLFSAFLFYLGVWFVKKFRNKPYGEIAVAAAGLNHPYIAVSNLATIFSGRLSLFLSSVVVFVVQFVVVKLVFFSGTVGFELDNVLDMLLRSAILLLPFIAEFLPKGISKLLSLRTAYYTTAAGILVIYPLFFVPFEIGWHEGLKCYYGQDYSEIPALGGNVRIVDSCRNWIYVFPVRGMTTSLSPYFEGQYYQVRWSEQDYRRYLEETATSYVIHCKDCKIRTKTFQETRELELLRGNYPLVLELKDFYVFEVRQGNS